MNVAPSPSLWRSLPGGLLGMLALVAGIEWFIGRHDQDLSNPVVANWQRADQGARSTARDCQLLCFGTSLTNNGIVPQVLERQLGRRTANLAVFGGPAPASEFLFKHAIEAGSRPVAVTFDCQDGPIEREHAGEPAEALWTHARQWPEILSLGECLSLSWSARDPPFFAMMALSKALPSVRTRFEIRAKLLAALRIRSGVSAPPGAPPRAGRGALEGPIMPWRPLEEAASGGHAPRAPATASSEFARPDWVRNRLSEHYAGRFAARAVSRGIPVFWLLPPVSPQVQQLRDRYGLSAHAADMARRAQARFPGSIVVIDGSHTRYAPPFFHDDLHLNRPGAVSYTADVASMIGRRLSDPSGQSTWIRLPDH